MIPLRVVGLLFYIEPLLQKTSVSTRDFVFTAFEICEVRLSYDGHTAVFLSVYRSPPTRQNKLTNAMFDGCCCCLFFFSSFLIC